MTMKVVDMAVTALKINPNRPRAQGEMWKELLDSIRERGIINPLAVRNDGFVIDGNDRLRAALELDMEFVPCIVCDMTDEQMMEFQLLQSVKKVPTTAKDLSTMVNKLLKQYTVEQIAEKINKPVSWVIEMRDHK